MSKENLLYLGIYIDIERPFKLAPNVTTIYGIDLITTLSTVAFLKTIKSSIIERLTKSKLKVLNDLEIVEDEDDGFCWHLSFTSGEPKIQRELVYYYYRSYQETWPEQINDIDHLLFFGSLITVDDLFKKQLISRCANTAQVYCENYPWREKYTDLAVDKKTAYNDNNGIIYYKFSCSDLLKLKEPKPPTLEEIVKNYMSSLLVPGSSIGGLSKLLLEWLVIYKEIINLQVHTIYKQSLSSITPDDSQKTILQQIRDAEIVRVEKLFSDNKDKLLLKMGIEDLATIYYDLHPGNLQRITILRNQFASIIEQTKSRFDSIGSKINSSGQDFKLFSDNKNKTRPDDTDPDSNIDLKIK